MRLRFVAGSVFALMVLLVFSTAGTARNESSCITCHTNAEALKRLCHVPELHTEEGG